MKKKIALLLVMMLCFFGVIGGMNTAEVKADAEDVTLVSSTSPRP